MRISQIVVRAMAVVVVAVLIGLIGRIVVSAPKDAEESRVSVNQPRLPASPIEDRAARIERQSSSEKAAMQSSAKPLLDELNEIDKLPDPARAGEGWVSTIDIPVPSLEAGMLIKLHVDEGQMIKEGDLMANIDARTVEAAKDTADWKLKAAQAEADSQINVEYAQAGRDVALAKLESSKQANLVQPNSFTRWDQRELAFKVYESQKHIEQAKHELDIAKMKVGVQKAELRAAELEIERREIRAPMSGFVEKKWHEVGEWVKPGDPVFRLIRLDEVYVGQFVDARKFTPAELERKKVLVTATLPSGEKVTLTGEVLRASNRVVASGSAFEVKAVVKNKQHKGAWVLRPGQPVQMTIQTGKG